MTLPGVFVGDDAGVSMYLGERLHQRRLRPVLFVDMFGLIRADFFTVSGESILSFLPNTLGHANDVVIVLSLSLSLSLSRSAESTAAPTRG